jgi:RhtB (resistance to homoserine/threonine) family protein
MTIATSLLSFSVAAAVLAMTPGVDTVLVLRTALSGNSKAAWLAALGILCGCLVWGLAVALGLGSLLVRAPLAFHGLQWLGAAYLVYLGLQQWRVARAPLALADGASALASASGHEAFRQGLVTNTLNPKVGLFYLTFLPQFLPTEIQGSWFLLVLAAIHILLSLLWFLLLVLASRPLARWLSRGSVQVWLHRATALVFVGFGIRLAWSEL